MNGAAKSSGQLRRAANWINGIPRFDGVLKDSIDPATDGSKPRREGEVSGVAGEGGEPSDAASLADR